MCLDTEGTNMAMTVVLAIAILWLLSGLICWAIFWFQNGRPLSETDRFCSRIDLALRRDYGARPGWFR